MLTIHHLGHSQSERILRLYEELGVPFELLLYQRDPVTLLSPPALIITLCSRRPVTRGQQRYI